MSTIRDVDFFFDVGSPYSYLAATQITGLSARTGAVVHWRPFLIGGVFKAVGNTMPAAVRAKAKWMLGDLQAWAQRYGEPFAMPPFFPLNTLKAQRALCGAERLYGQAMVASFALALFRAYWVDGQRVDQPEVIAACASAAELDADAVMTAMGVQETKDALRVATEDAVARGAFGAPTFFAGEAMFWGNDRLVLLEELLSA